MWVWEAGQMDDERIANVFTVPHNSKVFTGI